MSERLGETVAKSEEMATELAMKVRGLHMAVEAGEITYEEWEQMLRRHMEATKARLRLRDRPR